MLFFPDPLVVIPVAVSNNRSLKLHTDHLSEAVLAIQLNKKQAGAELCQAQVKLGLAQIEIF